MIRLTVAAFLAALLPAIAAAQDDSAAKATPEDSYAPHTCKKPVLIANIRRADDPSEQMEKADAYKLCIDQYVSTQNKLVQKHVDAANAAIADYNEFAKQYKAQQEQQQH